jgi:hypothetical protein
MTALCRSTIRARGSTPRRRSSTAAEMIHIGKVEINCMLSSFVYFDAINRIDQRGSLDYSAAFTLSPSIAAQSLLLPFLIAPECYFQGLSLKPRN